jgi:hypothetical protein
MRVGFALRQKLGVGALAGGLVAPAVAFPVVDPWADEVRAYSAGVGANPSYASSVSVLGAPEGTTGESFGADSAVTMFNPAFGTDELVSIGSGGWLDVRFDQPIVNDPAHAFGVDLIVFGNGGFVDFDPGDGVIDGPDAAFGSVFGLDLMDVFVSQNGVDWVSVGVFTEGLFPTQAWLDVPPFGALSGTQPADFSKPVDPSLGVSDFENLTYGQALALYDGSGGGTPIDIAASGLASIHYVRIFNSRPGTTVEIEAFAAVPEPGTCFLTFIGLCAVSLRRESLRC